jgi:signal transduction histidine kinase
MQHLAAELLKSGDVGALHHNLSGVECSCQEIVKAISACNKAHSGSFEKALEVYLRSFQGYWMWPTAKFEAMADKLSQWRQATDMRGRYLAGRGYCLLARHFLRQGNLAQADGYVTESNVVANSTGLKYLRGESFAVLSLAETEHCRWDRAIDAAEKAIAYFELSEDDLRGVAMGREALGRAYFGRGDYDLAHRELEGALHLNKRALCEYGQVEVQLLRAHICYHARDFRRHDLLVQEAEQLAVSLDYHCGVACAKRYRGKICLHEGRSEQALALFAESLAIYKSLGNDSGGAKCHLSLARTQTERKAWDQAQAEYTEAEHFFAARGDPVRAAMSRITQGLVRAKRDGAAKEAAAARLEKALEEMILALSTREANERSISAHRWLAQARTYAERQEWEDVGECLNNVRIRYRELETGRTETAIQEAQDALAVLQDVTLKAEAENLFASGIAVFRETGDRRHAATAMFETAMQYQEWGEYEQAASLLQEAMSRASEMHAERLAERCEVEKRLAETAGVLARWFLQARDQEKLRLSVLDQALHDVKGPAASISQMAENVQRYDLDPDRQKAYLGAIARRARYLKLICEGVLEARRAGGGQVLIECREVPLEPVVAEAMDIVDDAMAAKDRAHSRSETGRFRIDVPENVRIWGAPDHLLRLMVNLIENANRHTEKDSEGHNSIKVRAREARQPDGTAMVEVTIQDTGDGVPFEERQFMFDLYGAAASHDRQTRRAVTDAVKHFGMGLTYCKLVVESHGGRIWVDEKRTRTVKESPKEHGTAIHFTLPLPPGNAVDD